MCKLIGAKIQNGFYIPVFTKAEGQIYEFEEASKKSIGKNPLLQDPWEAKRVYVDASKLEQGGDGLFAKIPFTKGEVFSKTFVKYHNFLPFLVNNAKFLRLIKTSKSSAEKENDICL